VQLLTGKVDTVLTYSQSMSKQIKAVVITPDSYNSAKEYPVVYLLHGLRQLQIFLLW
jgi:enterochelin esterase-like enzyme